MNPVDHPMEVVKGGPQLVEREGHKRLYRNSYYLLV
jgi:hypothetical protein